MCLDRSCCQSSAPGFVGPRALAQTAPEPSWISFKKNPARQRQVWWSALRVEERRLRNQCTLLPACSGQAWAAFSPQQLIDRNDVARELGKVMAIGPRDEQPGTAALLAGPGQPSQPLDDPVRNAMVAADSGIRPTGPYPGGYQLMGCSFTATLSCRP